MKKFATVALALVTILVLVAGCGVEDDDSSGASSSAASSSDDNSSESGSTSASSPANDGWTKVGNLEMRVVGVEPYDSSQHNTFNTSNARAELRVRKVGGDEYDFTLATVTLIDTSGIGYDHDIFCADCPGMIDETVLYDSTTVTRYAYFDVPSLSSINRLRYEPLSFTTDPVVFPIP